MKQQTAIIGLVMLSLCAVAPSCSEDAGGFGSGEGRIMPTVAIDNEPLGSRSATPESRVDVEGVTVDDLSLRITKSDGKFQKEWDKLADYNTKQTFPVGEYTIEAFYGDPEAEGYELPAFSGSQKISVADGQTTQVALTATPSNAMLSIDYMDGFKAYMQSYSASFVTAKNAIDVPAEETRPVYVAPGQVTLNVAATTPTGTSANFKVKTFDVEAGYNYIVHVDVNEGEVGHATLIVEFDETLNEETVEIDISDDLLLTPNPTVTADGFTAGTAIEYVAGLGSDAKPMMSIVAMAGIQNVTLHTGSASLLKQGWPEDIDLLGNRDDKMTELGLKTMGLWNNPDKMAVIDFSEVLNHITAVGENEESTFTVTVVDKLNRTTEPLTLTVKAESPNLSLEKLETYVPGENLRVRLQFNGTPEQVRNNVEFTYDSGEAGRPRAVELVSVEPESRGMNSYVVTVTTPVLEEPLKLTASCGGVSSTCEIGFANFRVAGNDNDTYATHAYVTVAGTEGNSVDYANLKFYVKADGDDAFKEVAATNKGDYFDIDGLKPEAVNEVYVAIGRERSRKIKLQTEKTPQIPNAGFEECGKGSNHNEQTFAGWGTNNPMTTSQGINQDYTRYSGTATTAGKNGKGIDLRTCGWGSGNAIWISVKSSTVKYIDAGLIHLGSSRTVRPSGYGDREGCLNTDDLDCGISFTSRPRSMSFYYKYTSKNSADRGFAEIWVKDASGKIVASKTADLAPASDWTAATISLDYPFGSQKGDKIYVRFQSTNNKACLEKSDANFDLHVAKAFVASHLYIDEVELNY